MVQLAEQTIVAAVLVAKGATPAEAAGALLLADPMAPAKLETHLRYVTGLSLADLQTRARFLTWQGAADLIEQLTASRHRNRVTFMETSVTASERFRGAGRRFAAKGL